MIFQEEGIFLSVPTLRETLAVVIAALFWPSCTKVLERKEKISVYNAVMLEATSLPAMWVFVDREENKQPVIGDWYGYVNPAAISKILDAVLSGQVLIELWRGTLGLSQEEAESRIKKHDAARAPSCKVECGACDTPAAKCS